MVLETQKRRGYIWKTLTAVLFSLVFLVVLSAFLERFLPPEFQLLDFFSELSVLTFALMWFLLLRQITDKIDRKTVSLGILLFVLGAIADLLDEFGLLWELRSTVENLSFVGGFLLVSIGLRNWVNVNFNKYKEVLDKNEYLARHDHLTGLQNRESLMDALGFRLGRSPQARGFLAVIFMDLNRFKSVNDRLGHQTGDLLLKEAAERMKKTLRTTDRCFRIGGDEFVILATDIKQEEDAYGICRKLQDSFSPPFVLNGHKICTSGSFGIALHPRDGSDIEALIRNADLAMYAAKKEKTHICFFSEDLSRIAINKAQVESELRLALTKEELYMCYQVIVSRMGHPMAMEALVRWDHPVKGLIAPAGFIPIAEETGLIKPLGELILRQSLRDYRSHFSDLGLGLDITINVSALQMEDEGFPNLVLHALADSEVPPEKLVLEITESTIVENIDNFGTIMAPLLDAGVRFAMDDFGSGYSSLNYLQKLPVDFVKFDRELLNGVEGTASGTNILKGLVDITNGIGKQVIVEGVETGKQEGLFSSDENIWFQGFYYAFPKIKEEVREWLVQETERFQAG